MATVFDIIKSAYRILTVIDETADPTAEQATTGLEVLNEMLADYESEGLRLGWYPQDNLMAEAPLQDFDVRGVKILLAEELALHFGIGIDPKVEKEAAEVWSSISKRYIQYFETDLTGLPFSQGSLFGPGRV